MLRFPGHCCRAGWTKVLPGCRARRREPGGEVETDRFLAEGMARQAKR